MRSCWKSFLLDIIEGKTFSDTKLCIIHNGSLDRTQLSKISVSTVISPKFTKWLILMETDSLGGLEPKNETENFGPCTLGGTMLNYKIVDN